MSRVLGGLTFALVITVSATVLAAGKSSKQHSGATAASDTAATSSSAGGEEKTPSLSKDEQAKLREHMKMRNFIAKDVKYPATKADLMSKIKKTSIKQDDRKWFEQTVPDKTYNSAEEVYQALGWDTQAPGKGSESSK